MNELEIILSTALTFSILFNIFVIIYARSAISRLLYVSGELGDLKDMIVSFSNHISSIYEMEMFYGDQTLEDLMQHAKSFNEQLETFDFIYSLTEDGALEQGSEEIDIENNTDPAEA